MNSKLDYSKEFQILDNNLQKFIKTVKNTKSSLMATDEWNVKEVLCHIVFWHESYASNYKSLAKKEEPELLDGPGYHLNLISVSSLRKYSKTKLIQRLLKAQRSLKSSIVLKKVPQMTYKKDGRVYETKEFLDVIARHLATHTRHIKRAK